MRMATARDRDDDRRDRVDLGRHPEPDLRVDVQRQRGAADPGVEAVMTSRRRRAKAIIPPATIAGARERQGDVPERAPRRRAEVAGRLLEVRIQADRPCPDDDRHVRDAERDVRDRRSARTTPGRRTASTKNSSRLMPMTISGVTIGSRRSTSVGRAPALLEPSQAEPQERPERPIEMSDRDRPRPGG